MSDHGGGGGVNPIHDLLWFLGILVLMFLLWVFMGGPQKAKQKNESLFIHGPVNSKSGGTNSGGSGQIQVTPVQ